MFKPQLIKVFSEHQIEDLFLYLSNPAKYPAVVHLIKEIKEKIIEKRALFILDDYSELIYWLEDELAFAILINQNSKCDPFKFVEFQS